MDVMGTLTGILKWLGAADAAIVAMGPTLTWALAWVGGWAIAQSFKFPLSGAVKNDELHAHLTRLTGVLAAFGFAHYLSNHLTVPAEFLCAVTQPLFYLALAGATEKWAPWLYRWLFRTVDSKGGDP